MLLQTYVFGLRLLSEEASLISASVATTARASLVLSDLIVLIVTMHQTFHVWGFRGSHRASLSWILWKDGAYE